ncbi:hypothetical protein E2C01_072178 [Portunus trituberculatus]|uniref:Uncharacterized protein n=1 Tax=Portunus trituberculatus TaxID=210409 RepID=A0A5B7IAE3_PORTR|nr:hypothetical protein [Portunus trituberculatus]
MGGCSSQSVPPASSLALLSSPLCSGPGYLQLAGLALDVYPVLLILHEDSHCVLPCTSLLYCVTSKVNSRILVNLSLCRPVLNAVLVSAAERVSELLLWHWKVKFTCDICDKMFLNKVDADLLCYKNHLDMCIQHLPCVPRPSENIPCRN